MAETTGTSGAAGGVLAGQPGRIRNVALIGHSGAGKTTLVEALLATTGTIQRPGRVEEGTTVSDFDEIEVRQQRSVNLTLSPITHAGIKVNLLDTPGYADFTGDLRAGLRAADSALFAVPATDGVDGLTRMLWEECAAVGMPRAVVITKIDHQRADFDAALAACRDAFGEAVAPLYLPVSDGEGSGVARPDRPAVPAAVSTTPARPGPRPPCRPSTRTGSRSCAARPDRGDHPGERRRDPDGPVPVGRADRPEGTDRGPGEGRGPGQLLPGADRVRRPRDWHGRAAGGHDPGLPVAGGAPDARGDHTRRQPGGADCPATRPARCWPRWSRRPRTRTSAGSAWSGCSPARCAPTRPCTCPGTAGSSRATPTTTPTSGSAR